MKKLIVLFTLLLCFLGVNNANANIDNVIVNGSYITFGKYNGEKLVWRCIGDDGENGKIFISDKILTLKAFDAKGTDATAYNEQYGNGRWKTSNLRLWLNCADDSVKWGDANSPSAEFVKDMKNPYHDEKGFLCSDNFSPIEVNLLKEHTYKTLINYQNIGDDTNGSDNHIYCSNVDDVLQNYESAYSEMLKDKVYIPSVEDIYNINDIYTYGISYYMTSPTQVLADNNMNSFLELNTEGVWSYWLRDALYSTDDSKVRCVNNDGKSGYASAYDGEIGVRPMIVIDSTNAGINGGSGSIENPYNITGEEACVLKIKKDVVLENTDAIVNVYENIAEDVIIKLYHNDKMVCDNVTDNECSITAEGGVNIVSARVFDSNGNYKLSSEPIFFYGIDYEHSEPSFGKITFDTDEEVKMFTKNDGGTKEIVSYLEDELIGQEHANAYRLKSSNKEYSRITTKLELSNNTGAYVDVDVMLDNISLVDSKRILFLTPHNETNGTAYFSPFVINSDGSLEITDNENVWKTDFVFKEKEWYNIKVIIGFEDSSFTLIINNDVICYNTKLKYEFDYIKSFGLNCDKNSSATEHTIYFDNVLISGITENIEFAGMTFYSTDEKFEIAIANPMDEELLCSLATSVFEKEDDAGDTLNFGGVKIEPISIEPRSVKLIQKDFDSWLKNGNIIKAFLLKDMKSIVPLTDMQSLTVD